MNFNLFKRSKKMSKEREIIEQQIKDHQKAIDSAKAKLDGLTVTYSIGDRFKNRSGKYLLACTDTNHTVHLVNLACGSHLSGSWRVGSVYKITQAELNRLFASNISDPVRYWDDKKKIYTGDKKERC
jgi:hypothetical protein